MTKEEVAGIIDHTVLNAYASKKDVEKICMEAKKCNFASVCINPVHVPYAAGLLAGSNVAVCTVIGFPLGADKSEVKAFGASQAVMDGADEVDMVIDIGAAKEGRFDDVRNDIARVVEASKSAGSSFGKNVIVKVILETCYLTDGQIEKACIAAKEAGADFVKTSTGFGTPKNSAGEVLPNGASVHHVELMRKTVGPDMGVKASGGIRSARSAVDLIKAGASRLGTSSGLLIIDTWE